MVLNRIDISAKNPLCMGSRGGALGYIGMAWILTLRRQRAVISHPHGIKGRYRLPVRLISERRTVLQT
jgi:hypothetical protein